MTIEYKLRHQLPACDFAVMEHGPADYMRDYALVVQLAGHGPAAGVYRCLFTHCVLARLEMRVRDDVWPRSWGDEFIDHETWHAAGEPDGFVWGTKWSLAYPGLKYVADSEQAATWTSRLGQEMHEISLETEAFSLQLIFHDFRMSQLSNEQAPLSKVLNPLKPNSDA